MLDSKNMHIEFAGLLIKTVDATYDILESQTPVLCDKDKV